MYPNSSLSLWLPWPFHSQRFMGRTLPCWIPRQYSSHKLVTEGGNSDFIYQQWWERLMGVIPAKFCPYKYTSWGVVQWFGYCILFENEFYLRIGNQTVLYTGTCSIRAMHYCYSNEIQFYYTCQVLSVLLLKYGSCLMFWTLYSILDWNLCSDKCSNCTLKWKLFDLRDFDLVLLQEINNLHYISHVLYVIIFKLRSCLIFRTFYSIWDYILSLDKWSNRTLQWKIWVPCDLLLLPQLNAFAIYKLRCPLSVQQMASFLQLSRLRPQTSVMEGRSSWDHRRAS